MKELQLIQQALDNAGNTHDVADVLEMVQAGKAFMFPLEKSVIVCDMMRCPNEDIWRYWLAAGDLEELKVNEELITQWARHRFGVQRSMIFGRPGWSKTFAPTYRETHRVLFRSI
jgi:hypothetical protein